MNYHRDVSSIAELIIWKITLNILTLKESSSKKIRNTCTNLLDSDLTSNEEVLVLRGQLFLVGFPISIK